MLFFFFTFEDDDGGGCFVIVDVEVEVDVIIFGGFVSWCIIKKKGYLPLFGRNNL